MICKIEIKYVELNDEIDIAVFGREKAKEISLVIRTVIADDGSRWLTHLSARSG